MGRSSSPGATATDRESSHAARLASQLPNTRHYSGFSVECPARTASTLCRSLPDVEDPAAGRRLRFRHAPPYDKRVLEKPGTPTRALQPTQEEKLRCVSRMHCKAGPLAA